MVTATLKCLVLKTASVGSVTLLTAADRIGTQVNVHRTPPANLLSLGQFFMPPRPMRKRMESCPEDYALRYEPMDMTPASLVGRDAGTSRGSYWQDSSCQRNHRLAESLPRLWHQPIEPRSAELARTPRTMDRGQ